MGMTEKEKQYKKYIRKNILAENGYATYAEILGLLDLHITQDPNVVAYMNPKTGEITINGGLDRDAVSVVIRHEILHHFLNHEKRLLAKLAKSSGMDADKLDDMSLKQLRNYLYRNKNFNIAGDYEISNRGYTEEDKNTVRALILNGNVLRGLVTEDDHPDWAEWPIEDMYDALNKKTPPTNQPPQFPQPPEGGGEGGEGGTGGGGQNPPGDGSKPDNPNIDVQNSIEDVKRELSKAGFDKDQIDKIIDEMEKHLPKGEGDGDDYGPGGDGDDYDPYDDEGDDGGDGGDDYPYDDGGDGGDIGGVGGNDGGDEPGEFDPSKPGSGRGGHTSPPDYVDPTKFKSDEEIKKELKDQGLGERDIKRILKKVKAAKKVAEEEAEKDRQEGAKEGEIGYKGDKEIQEKEKKEREAQIKKEQEEKAKNKDSQSDSDDDTDGEEEDEYKDYEDDYDSSTETIQQRRDRLSKISKVFSDPVMADRIDRENRKKIQASRDEKARKEVRRYMTSDAMKFQMNIKRFLNNEFGEDRDTTWSRRNRTNFGGTKKLLKPGVKIQDTERPTKPLINVYFDQSGSWSLDDLRAGNQAVSQMNKYVKEGKLEVQVYYFNDELHTSPPGGASGGMGGTDGMPIIQNIKQTNPDNVIIMTDWDISDITESVTIPGMVWILWKNGQVSQNLKDNIHGQRGTEYYNIEVKK